MITGLQCNAIGSVMDLVKLCSDLVAIPSPSHREEQISDFVFNLLQGFEGLSVTRIGNNVVATSHLGRGRKVILAGHLDTVPANGNEQPRISDGTISGLGSADMKSGLAVMIGLAQKAATLKSDVTFLFYVCEEVASKFSGLAEIGLVDSSVLTADAAILLEPTNCRIEAGCQGTMRVKVEVLGRSAHTARPWMGVNAVHRLGDLIKAVASFEPRQPLIDGLVFRESLQVVGVEGGKSNNVVPDLASLVVNYRFAPDRTLVQAEAYLRDLFSEFIFPEQGDSLELIEGIEGALPNLERLVIEDLAKASGLPPRAKLGWTDVAYFASRGIPATNFGPGDPLVAHTKDEYVSIDEIGLAFNLLSQIL